MPILILLHICSYLDASTLVHNLGLVCKYLNQILNDDSLWRARISQIWPNVGFPVLPPDKEDELFYKLSCVSIERQMALWKKPDALEKLTLIGKHYGTIDGLLLMHNGTICISGGRDRSLVCWNLPADENEQCTSTGVETAHTGWIWGLTSIENTIYSCGWDGTVNAWALCPSGLSRLKTYDMAVPRAVLCISSCPETSTFAAGSASNTVFVFDPRSCEPVAKFRPHHNAILKLAMNAKFILTASEDKTVSVWDQRARRTLTSITMSNRSFPMSISMHREIVHVGDSSGNLHILDPKNDFTNVKCYMGEHLKGINGVHYTPGCLITVSLDRTVKISSPTDPPLNLNTLNCHYGEIASSAYMNEVLAVAAADVIEIWRPKMQFR
ncbi:F-box/WD repeat-containing protein 9 isoform X2 [Orussus abietinus]|uniref:F-box/WD repeat-containing protein 9 isoform X2 n=1 Tax=Orussus abietinus TaxID=222816 RepID=UPI000625DC89|nr:F-box/WD repeat-containing protein 9 isoform X2 [Orussus abietinus]